MNFITCVVNKTKHCF